jgi:transcriptional regulator with XRE-family HTH domain
MDAEYRPRLLALEPIGLGTVNAESMWSYCLRLAARHRVKLYRLLEFVAQRSDVPRLLGGRMSKSVLNLDSATPDARDFARALATLTETQAVATLGLGWLSQACATHSASRRNRTWCPMCLTEARAAGQESSIPLSWLLRRYERCTIHNTLLLDRCVQCGHSDVVGSRRSGRLDHCSWCDNDLATAQERPTFRSAARALHVGTDQRLALAVGELIIRAPLLANQANGSGIARAVQSAIDRDIVKSDAALAQRAGVAKSTLCRLTSDPRARPSVDVLFRVAAAADVSIAGMLRSDLWRERPWSRRSDVGPIAIPPKRKPRIDWADVRAQVECLLVDEESVPTVAAIAAEVRVDAAHLSKVIPDLRARVQATALTRTSVRQAQQDALLAQRIEAFLAARRVASRRISWRSASRELQVSRHCKRSTALWHALTTQ